MILFEIILAISELFFSVAGYTMVSELAPNNYFSLFLGIFLATRGVSTYITGIICTTFPEPNNVLYHIWNIPINGLGGFFSIFLILNIITGIIIFIYRNKSDKCISMILTDLFFPKKYQQYIKKAKNNLRIILILKMSYLFNT